LNGIALAVNVIESHLWFKLGRTSNHLKLNK